MRPRVLLVRGFARAARSVGLTPAAIAATAAEIEAGLIDARLGGVLIKKRIAIGGRGKRGGLRSVLAYRHGDRMVFLYLFAKNERETISQAEQAALAELGTVYLGLSDAALDGLVAQGVLTEVT